MAIKDGDKNPQVSTSDLIVPQYFGGGGNQAQNSDVAQRSGGSWVIAQSHAQLATPLDTNDNVLFTFTVPGKLMGPNDALRISANMSHLNSANSKTTTIRFRGVTVYQLPQTTSSGSTINIMIANRGNQFSQISRPYGTSGGSGSSILSAVDTTIDQQLTLSIQKALGSENAALESILVELIRAANP